MSTYEPSGDQIEALAEHMSDGDWEFVDEPGRRVVRANWRRQIASPAFQAIIRAAQSEAWGEGYGDDSECQTPRTNPYRKATA